MYDEGITGATGRVVGIELKEKIIEILSKEKYDKVVLDFSEVDFVTSGFAKELFCGLYDVYKKEFSTLFSVKLGKENGPLRQTIIRALTTAISNKNDVENE